MKCERQSFELKIGKVRLKISNVQLLKEILLDLGFLLLPLLLVIFDQVFTCFNSAIYAVPEIFFFLVLFILCFAVSILLVSMITKVVTGFVGKLIRGRRSLREVVY